MSPKELIVSSQDNRIRLIEIGANGMNTVGKYKGHQSSAGDVALAAFVVSPPFSDAMLLSGSECGRVFVWTLDEGRDLADASVSLRTKLTGSHAARPIDSWKAISAPDKLTAVAYAPWNPERGSVSASSSIAASLDGVVRLFITKYH
jgi:WD40 repeat protein